MNPNGLKRFRRYQNDEHVKEQKWNAKFKRLTKVFYDTSNETRNEIMQNRVVFQQTMSEMYDGLKTRVEISEKKVLNIDSHVVNSDTKVETIASRVEKMASEKAMSDKRIGDLEKKFKSLSHLQKSSRTKQRKEKDDDCVRKTRPIHKAKEKESRLRRSRNSDNNESSQSSSSRFRSLSPPDLTGSIMEQLDSNTNANKHQQSGGTAEQVNTQLIPLSQAQLQALNKGGNCVNFIGNLVLESYPEGYFLEKKNSFKHAVSSHHMDTFFEIVSSKYEQIERRGHPIKQLTMKEMLDVMRNRVSWYRKKNRPLIE